MPDQTDWDGIGVVTNPQKARPKFKRANQAYDEQKTKLLNAQNLALGVAWDFGDAEGASHRQWVINEMVKALTGHGYESWVADWEEDHPGYDWDRGVFTDGS